ncbi:hypothetical protein HKD21_09100 [Gluconobacter cerevisiae]|uniref:Flagellar hook-length control protein FliK n=1 Tax=Gluconobacter cerevisiae TaxID=1379734 RepID=A0ABR9YEA5_9PROT|nr:hypothetical protein [Gluconobacter cerevisiae]MBF0877005.1 hypothetical protein [Gluconobacter cerevisiae]
MSHVTTSAVTSIAGLGRTDIAPGAQLASNERFHEFLESYVHPETPKHFEVSQKASITKPQATKVEPVGSEHTTQKQPSKVRTLTKSTMQQSTDSSLEDRTHLLKQGAVTKNKALPDTVEKTISGGSQKQLQNNINQKNSSQSIVPDSDDKHLPSDDQEQAKNTLSQTKKNDFTTNGIVNSFINEENSNYTDKKEINTELSLMDNNCSSEESNNPEIVSGDCANNIKIEENSTKENTPFIDLESISPDSSEKTLSESLEEVSSKAQTENETVTPGDEEKPSSRADAHTLLYQQENNGNTTTHIEMNVGRNEKIHVEINRSESKDHRIHINTDDPKIYQSLKADQDILVAALSDNSCLTAGMQPIARADIQISLSLPAFLDMSSRDERQEGKNRSLGLSRDSASDTSSSTTKRRFISGVVDLTV